MQYSVFVLFHIVQRVFNTLVNNFIERNTGFHIELIYPVKGFGFESDGTAD